MIVYFIRWSGTGDLWFVSNQRLDTVYIGTLDECGDEVKSLTEKAINGV